MSELTVLVALLAGIAGATQLGTERGAWLIGAALTLGSLAGARIAWQEHKSGRRDRTALLACTVAAVASAAGLVAGLGWTPSALLAVIAGVLAALALRRTRRHGAVNR